MKLLYNRLCRSLPVSKWFSSIMSYSIIYLVLNLVIAGGFSCTNTIITFWEKFIYLAIYPFCLASLLWIVNRSFIERIRLVEEVAAGLLLFICWLIQSAVLFLFVSGDIIQVSFQVLIIDTETFVSSGLSNRFRAISRVIEEAPSLYVILCGSLLLNLILLSYPVFILLQFKTSGHKRYFRQYLKLRKSVYERTRKAL